MAGRQSQPGEKPARLLRASDFVRVLAAPQRSRSAHFAVHFVDDRPSVARKPVVPELSTDDAPFRTNAVDDLPDRHWLGMVVPKRHARRAVTRTLIKRQMREAMGRHASHLACGLWVLRLRAPFDPVRFPSAASDALKAATRTELDGMLARAGT
jgi:ribonuclease P protein component